MTANQTGPKDDMVLTWLDWPENKPKQRLKAKPKQRPKTKTD